MRQIWKGVGLIFWERLFSGAGGGGGLLSSFYGIRSYSLILLNLNKKLMLVYVRISKQGELLSDEPWD